MPRNPNHLRKARRVLLPRFALTLAGVMTLSLTSPNLSVPAALAQDNAAAPASGAAPAGPPPVSVTVAKVQTKTMQSWTNTEGTAQASRREIMHFGRSGKVVEIGQDSDGLAIREGSAVKGPSGSDPGTLIARLDERSEARQVDQQLAQAKAARQRVTAAQSNVDIARSGITTAQDALARTQQLVQTGAAPRKQLGEDEKALTDAQADLERTLADLAAAEAEADAADSTVEETRLKIDQSRLTAPFDGIISFMNVSVGDYVSPLTSAGMSLGDLMRQAAAVLIDPSEYEILVEVPSAIGLDITRGQTAQVTWSGLTLFDRYDAAINAGDEKAAAEIPIAKAEVYAVAPAIAPDSRAIRVRLRTTAGAEHLRDGLFVAVRIQSTTIPNAMVIPVQSLAFDAGGAHVFVLGEDGKTVTKTPVQLGISDGTSVSVSAGLTGSETIVTQGQTRLSDGATVRVIDPAAAPTAADQDSKS